MTKIIRLAFLSITGMMLFVSCKSSRETQLETEVAQLKIQSASQQRDVEIVKKLKTISGLPDDEFYSKINGQLEDSAQNRNEAMHSVTQSYLRNSVTAAEVARMDGKQLSDGAIDCVSIPNFSSAGGADTNQDGVVDSALPESVVSCRIKQDNNNTYAYAQSKDGKYYSFDGSTISEVSAPPAGF